MPLAPGALRGPRSWTLRAKLVASMIALFLLVTAGTGAMIVLATNRYLAGQLDRELQQTATRINDGGRDHRGPGDGDELPPLVAPGGGGAVLRLALRNNAVVTDAFGREINWVPVGSTTQSLTQTQIDTLQQKGIGAQPVTVQLGDGVGPYRVVAVSRNGVTYFTGLPMSGITDTTNQLLWLVVAGSLAGLLVVGAGGTYLVRRNLAPLQRVATTARRVSTLPLDRGEVALAERVAPEDTDPNTEVGQVGLALNGMLDNVDHALQARQESETRVRQFVADASHELRTPLASIRGYAELSRREKESVPPTVTHALGRVESEAVRMQDLVEDLLLLARLDSGRPLEHEPVDLTLLAMDAVSDARAASPSHRWELALPDEPIEVPGDQARLHQVVANLLANARTHTPAGTRVVTSLRHEGDTVELAVTDNGPGIPETLQRNVFERFVRGDEARTRATGSSGLGLSIVAAVTAAHGGRVGLLSRPGETSFVVELPAR